MKLKTLMILLLSATPAVAEAKSFTVDAGHSAILFKAKHFNAGYTYGMFRDFSGSFSMAGNKSSVSLEVNASSVFTGIKKRDGHLMSPDFLNVKQFPKVTFVSTRVSKRGKTYVVAGKLTLHGVTKSVSVKMKHVGTGKGPKGEERVGLEGTFKIKRSAYNMTKMVGPVADEITLTIAVEGVAK